MPYHACCSNTAKALISKEAYLLLPNLLFLQKTLSRKQTTIITKWWVFEQDVGVTFGKVNQFVLNRIKETQTGLMHACSVSKSCPTLCNPMDCSPPGSSVHGILQAKTLVWVAVPSPRGSWITRVDFCLSLPVFMQLLSCILLLSLWQTPQYTIFPLRSRLYFRDFKNIFIFIHTFPFLMLLFPLYWFRFSFFSKDFL